METLANELPDDSTGRSFPILVRDRDEDNPVWQAHGSETWWSSSDDEESDISSSDMSDEDIPSRLQERTVSSGPRLSAFIRIVPAQKQRERRRRQQQQQQQQQRQQEQKQHHQHSSQQKSTMTQHTPSTGEKASSWLAMRAVSSNGKAETPVPLPSTVVNAKASAEPGSTAKPHTAIVATMDAKVLATQAGTAENRPCPTPVSQKPVMSNGGRKSSATTPTPVPLPPLVREPAPAPGYNIHGPKVPEGIWTTTTAAQQDDVSRGPAEKLPKPTSTRATAYSPQDALLLATDGRPYAILIGQDGAHISSRGVVFPAGYRFHEGTHPYICPMRDCRRLLKSLESLAGHFGASHSYAAVNDNLDGTLSQIGSYRNPSGSSPCMVVSQVALAPDAPPPVTPSLALGPASTAKQKRKSPPDTAPDAHRPEKMPASAFPFGNSLGHGGRLKEVNDPVYYINSVVHPRQVRPKRLDIEAMVRLPRKRSLPATWLAYYKGKNLTPQVYACSLAYIVGDEVLGDAVCLEPLKAGGASRLSAACIRLPQLGDMIHRAFSTTIGTCVGCAYIAFRSGRENRCKLKTRPQVDSTTTGLLPHGNTKSESRTPSVWSSSVSHSTAPPAPDRTLASRRTIRQSILNRLQADKEHVREAEKLALEEARARHPSTAHLESTELSRSASSSSSASTSEPEPPRLAAQTNGVSAPTTQDLRVAQPTATSRSRPEDPGLVQPGRFGSPDYELEEWEMAPGRLANTTTSQNVAYSGAFLTSSAPIAIAPDICFNVLIVRPGQTHRIRPEKDRMRVFSVASGKVTVTVRSDDDDDDDDDAQVVKLGPNGAFPLRPGGSCTIENRLYFEAMVHCTTVKDYQLAP